MTTPVNATIATTSAPLVRCTFRVVGVGITPNARASATMAIVPVERRAPTSRGTVTMGAQLRTRPR